MVPPCSILADGNRDVSGSQRLRRRLAGWSGALAAALRERGAPSAGAGLLAEVALAVFRAAFERWVEAGEQEDLAALVRDALGELRLAVA
jgi:hypothetical protein